MRRFRSSIAGLLGVVVLVAVALAALRDPTDAWDSGVLGLILLILLTATLLVVHRTRRKRAYWLGFGLFGWAYLIASLIPSVGSRLPTTMGLAYLHSKLPMQETASGFLYRLLVSGDAGRSERPQPVVPDLSWEVSSDWAYTWMVTGAALPGPGSPPANFVRIGHSLLTLVLASIGGRLSRWLLDRNHVGTAGGEDHPPDYGRRP
jgi:hypothetical protein